MADKLILEMSLEPSLSGKGAKDLERESQKAGKKSGKKFEEGFEKETVNIGDSLKKSFKGLGLAIAGVGVGRVLANSIDLAKRQEDAINGLNVALQITGKYSEKASGDIQRLASEIQQATRFGDEELLETASLIQQLGNLTVDELGEATKATTDLAAALRIDLTTAATLVGKAAAGNVSSFSRYGVAIKTGKTNAETFANTLEALNKKFGGAAAGQVNTFSGAVDQLGNTFGDTLEEVGAFATKNLLLAEVVKGTTSALQLFGSGLRVIRKEILGIGETESEKPVDKINKAMSETRRELNGLIDRKKELEDGIFGFTLAEDRRQAELLGGKITALQNRIRDLRLERAKAREDSKKEADSGTGDEEKKVEKLLTREQLLAQAKISNDERIKESALAREQALTELNERQLISDQEFTASFLEIERQKEEQLKAFDQQRLERTINSSEDIGGAFLMAAKNSKKSAIDLGKTLNTLAIKGFGNAFSKIGAALAKGESANEAFVQSAKATASEAAGAFGDYYIAEGVAQLAQTGGVKGGETLAAGLGLKAVAGALGAGSGSSGSSGGGSGSASSQPATLADTGALEQADVERANPSTNVEVVVQGSLVQQEELGTFITETLNESFGKQGVSLTDVRIA